MKKTLILAACMVACACQPKAPMKDGNGDDQNYHDRRAQKPQGGCCETEKTQAPQESQTVATPEVKTETVQ
jgi:hypothetical protein